MRCNLAFRLAVLLAAIIFGSVNSLVFPASSTPDNTIATNDRGGCEHKDGCFPL